ncbi:hypothetical protein [Terribacillus sp. 7520-G]|uniref:hypothetical protein n=1 Tax=Terribacillus sp. 7520-G TaxID=2025389 RepID=UPI000BA5678D|nr:hypothetical protein [Terribacillus sp. 7520-G]PAD39849.1 hypothetical protein CHH53_03970 [Terribacillus sp. 7520-G]
MKQLQEAFKELSDTLNNAWRNIAKAIQQPIHDGRFNKEVEEVIDRHLESMANELWEAMLKYEDKVSEDVYEKVQHKLKCFDNKDYVGFFNGGETSEAQETKLDLDEQLIPLKSVEHGNWRRATVTGDVFYNEAYFEDGEEVVTHINNSLDGLSAPSIKLVSDRLTNNLKEEYAEATEEYEAMTNKEMNR